MMIKYTDEQKSRAMELVAQKGIRAAHEELGIAMQTLYKWRNSAGAEPSPRGRKPKQQTVDNEKLVNDSEYLETKVKTLEAEVQLLLEKNAALRKALAAFID